MALTRMPSGPKSIAICRVIPITADFPASYTSRRGAISRPCTDDRLTIAPPPDRSITGTACFTPRKIAVIRIASPWFQCSSETSTALPCSAFPPA